MTPKQTALAQSSFAQVAPVAEIAAPPLFDPLPELNPSLRGWFEDGLRHQRMKSMAMLTTAINNLHQLDAVAPRLRQRGLPHVGYRVKPAAHDAVTPPETRAAQQTETIKA
jgi:hypothetical protein